MSYLFIHFLIELGIVLFYFYLILSPIIVIVWIAEKINEYLERTYNQ